MREPGRNPQHVVVLLAQLRPEPTPERRRRPAQIHSDIVDGAATDAHELALRLPHLIVQAAQHPLRRMTVIVLHELDRDTRVAQRAAIPRLEEVAAIVAEHARLDQHDIGNARRNEIHAAHLPGNSDARYAP